MTNTTKTIPTRTEIIERLARNVVYLNGQYPANFAVILSNYNEVKQFSRDFYAKLDEVPKWMMLEIRRRNIQTCEWGMSKIMFVCNPAHLKGCSLDALFRSKRALREAGSEELEYFNFLSALSGQNVTDFED